jgi:hypothetical protein
VFEFPSPSALILSKYLSSCIVILYGFINILQYIDNKQTNILYKSKGRLLSANAPSAKTKNYGATKARSQPLSSDKGRGEGALQTKGHSQLYIQHTPTSLAHVAFCCLSLMVFNPLLYQRAAWLFAFCSPPSYIPLPPSCSPSFHFIPFRYIFGVTETDGDQHQRQQTMRANHAVF